MLAELLFGAEKSARREENRKRVEAITQRFPVLPMTLSLVERYASVRAAVERLGRRKSDFDLVIACTARHRFEIGTELDDGSAGTVTIRKITFEVNGQQRATEIR